MRAARPEGSHEGPPLRPQPDPDRVENVLSLVDLLMKSDPGASRIRRWTDEIGRSLVVSSLYAWEPHFSRLHVDDLSFLFAAYDGRFLNGLCGKLLGPDGLTFRLSRRMTRAAAQTTRSLHDDGTISFEIAVATTILFNNFAQGDPEVTVGGLPCRNRLEALQRLLEHEIVHLAEWLCWQTSHCGRERFQGIARRLFGHQSHTHLLITPAVRAANLGFTVGVRAKFRYGGRWLTGRVNRITKRATVLVPDPDGELMSDGRRYVRYYIPLGHLHHVADDPARKSGKAR